MAPKVDVAVWRMARLGSHLAAGSLEWAETLVNYFSVDSKIHSREPPIGLTMSAYKSLHKVRRLNHHDRVYGAFRPSFSTFKSRQQIRHVPVSFAGFATFFITSFIHLSTLGQFHDEVGLCRNFPLRDGTYDSRARKIVHSSVSGSVNFCS